MNKLMILHADEIATPKGTTAVLGQKMNNLTIIKDGAVVIEDEIIQAVDTTEKILDKYNPNEFNIIDASNKCLVPGFVDSHTHFIFGGYRPEEFIMRLNGKSYMEIMNEGGGIESTVQATRESSFNELCQSGLDRLDSMLSFGITTVEGKSGYGLDLNTEMKQLNVMKKLNEMHSVDIVSTFLGAHAIPKEYKERNSNYIDFIISDVLPQIKVHKLAEYCDVFCEEGVISIEESKRLLTEARKLGFGLKIHADEIEQLGGAELAAELDVTSADHLLEASDDGIRQLAKHGIVATLLPATAFCLNKRYANARKMIDNGCAVALASDINPGSCFTDSTSLILALACIHMRMTVEEALTAFTLNGAAAIDRADQIGSIEVGKQADILILKYSSYQYLVYNTAVNIIDKVIKKGVVVKNN